MPAAVTSVSLEKELSRSVAEQSHLEIHNLQKAAGTQARVFIGSGDPAAVITDATKQFESDILVVGRGHSDDSYAIIRDSPCPVISI
jgi:nucleotide-binding universal stress UspA family protein